jgi:Retrotransposon gag protein
MPPTTRSSLRFEPIADGGWRVLEGGIARNLTSEDLNEFGRQWSDCGQALAEAEAKSARLAAENEEAESRLKEMEDAVRRGEEELKAKESVLEQMANDRSGRIQVPQDQEISGPPKATEHGFDQLGHQRLGQLGSITAALSRLTAQVNALTSERNQRSELSGNSEGVSRRTLGATLLDKEEWGGMGAGVANKVYKDNLTAVIFSKAGDSKFAAARACWDRLCLQFPVSPLQQPKLVAHAFSGAASAVYQQVAATMPRATADELWDAMEKRLYNEAQVRIQRGKFYGAKMGRDETVEDFAERLRELSCGLPEQVTEHVLLQRMVEGLPNELKLQAAVASSDFDVAVGQLSQLSELMEARARRRHEGREVVNHIGERVTPRELGARDANRSADKEWRRDRAAPRGSLENPVGFDPTNPQGVRPWNRSRQCYGCKQFGHIRVGGTQECG